MRKLLLVALLLVAATAAVGQSGGKKCPEFSPSKEPGKWLWMDRECEKRSRADLERILAKHRLWLGKYKPELRVRTEEIQERVWRDPLRADLSGAQLDDADLTGAELNGADLNGARLFGADFTGAELIGAGLTGSVLIGADLTGADLESADLTGADFRRADLTRAYLGGADLTGAYLQAADLTDAELYGGFGGDLIGANLALADLTGANFVGADLTGAYFFKANLTGAQLNSADLIGANFLRADLADAHLDHADLSGTDLTGVGLWNADFEPKAIPAASAIARAEGLRTLRWNAAPDAAPGGSWWTRLTRWFGDRKQDGNRNPMQDLRKELHDAGYIEAEREVNLAYHRMEQSWWEEIVFDWSCEWGANWRRPLGIAAGLGLVCSVLYWFLLRFTRRNRLFVIGKNGKREQRLRVGSRGAAPGWFQVSDGDLFYPWCGVVPPWRRVRWEMRLYWTAALFSLMSVLNLGVQGFDLGRWVRLMHWRDFDLEARGTIRAIAGVQSVVSFALLALAALSYFGHPFE